MSGIREPDTLRIGAVGLAVSVAIVVAGLQYDQLQFLSGGLTYSARFADAGGLIPGDDVTLSGVDVGSVTDVALDGDAVLVTFSIRDGIGLATVPAPISRPTPCSVRSPSPSGRAGRA